LRSTGAGSSSQPRRSAESGTGPGTLTFDCLIIDDARDYLPLFQIDRVFGPYAGRLQCSVTQPCRKDTHSSRPRRRANMGIERRKATLTLSATSEFAGTTMGTSGSGGSILSGVYSEGPVPQTVTRCGSFSIADRYGRGRIALRNGSSSGNQIEWRINRWISNVASPMVNARECPPAFRSSETKWK